MNNLLKELGKYFFDISKLLLGVAIITPLIKNKDISIISVIMAVMMFLLGITFTYKGGENE